MLKRIFVIIILALPIGVFAQTEKQEEARKKANEAIKLMDSGKPAESIPLLEEAKKLDPDNITYSYEMAFAYSLMKEYDKAIKILNKLTSHKNAYDLIYQMLGNCYDYKGDSKKAVEVYEKGLKKFPNSGKLHLEMGIMMAKREDYTKALQYHEAGIKVEPGYSSNYYWACKYFFATTEEVWGMIYGEIFMNLERNTKRTVEISALLFKVYNKEIKFTSDTTVEVSFSKNNTISISDPNDLVNMKLPFPLMVYEPLMLASCVLEKKITLESLNRIRANFLNLYLQNDIPTKYPNILFDYQQKVNTAGHLESYNYWLLMKGDEEEFTAWKDKNKEKWDSFIEWYGDNKMVVDENHTFHRTQY